MSVFEDEQHRQDLKKPLKNIIQQLEKKANTYMNWVSNFLTSFIADSK